MFMGLRCTSSHARRIVAKRRKFRKSNLVRTAGLEPGFVVSLLFAKAVLKPYSTLQRQAKDFFQNLTVEVAGSKNAAEDDLIMQVVGTLTLRPALGSPPATAHPASHRRIWHRPVSKAVLCQKRNVQEEKWGTKN